MLCPRLCKIMVLTRLVRFVFTTTHPIAIVRSSQPFIRNIEQSTFEPLILVNRAKTQWTRDEVGT